MFFGPRDTRRRIGLEVEVGLESEMSWRAVEGHGSKQVRVLNTRRVA